MRREAAYLRLNRRGVLAKRVALARKLLESCQVCPHCCHVDRLAGERGKCRTGARAIVSSYGPHFGEEAPLVGASGSGTIFFTNCNLKCVFCQNYSISQLGEGREVTGADLAGVMLHLQHRGCHNINLVSPTHVVPQILEALELAAGQGLSVPLVYNSGGYDAVETLALLDGVVDIYMPDVKFYDDRTAARFLKAPDYGSRTREALKAMHSQVGDLQIGPGGIALRGLLIRHLVLPEGLAGTGQWAAWIARELSPDTYVNIMDQYRPCFAAVGDKQIGRRLGEVEYRSAVQEARAAGLRGRGFERMI